MLSVDVFLDLGFTQEVEKALTGKSASGSVPTLHREAAPRVRLAFPILVSLHLLTASIGLALAQYTLPGRDPCTNPTAYCRTESDGSRWCGFKGETIQRCPDSDDLPKPPPARMDPLRQESEAERIERLRQECRDRVGAERAKEGPGKLSALIDATKLAGCNAIK
jgi:hypothetical protein